jgi:hypothetical protein
MIQLQRKQVGEMIYNLMYKIKFENLMEEYLYMSSDAYLCINRYNITYIYNIH